jgi:hypothetical protein
LTLETAIRLEIRFRVCAAGGIMFDALRAVSTLLTVLNYTQTNGLHLRP